MTWDHDRLPAPLASARRGLEEWRSSGRKPHRIPAPLWRAAVRCAARYGLCPTARALGLDYNSLKRRVNAEAERPATVSSSPPAFVEFVTSDRGAPAECILEIERPGGAKLRLELRGSGIPDVADLALRFASETA